MSGVKCRIWYDTQLQAYYCSTPYSKEFVEFLKMGIPASDRAYDPSTKVWSFTDKYFDIIADMARRVWRGPGEVVIITKAQAEAAQQSAPGMSVSKQTPGDVLKDFAALLPVEALEAAYKRACMTLHPDKGGSMEKMSQLNALWTRIKQDKGIK